MKKLHLNYSTSWPWLALSLAALLASTLHAPAVDTQPPNLTILSTNVQFLRTATFEIYGTADDDVGLKTLKVLTGTAATGYSVMTNINLSGRFANWSVTVTLAEGLNYFLIKLTDASGKSACDLTAPSAHASCGQIYTVFSTNAARTPFEAWQVANFTLTELSDSTVSGPDADPDGDGVKNFFEYTVGTNPKVASQSAPPTASVENSYLTMTYTQAKNASDTTNTVRVSTDLSTWNSGSNYSTLISTQDLGATIRFKARLTQPIANAPAGFMRLDVQRVAPTLYASAATVFDSTCQSCHLPGGSSGIPWYDGVVREHLVGVGSKIQEEMPLVFPGFPEYSALYYRVSSTDPTFRMPYMQPALSASQIETMRKWIQDGALP